jgi:hypothetical protein
MLPVLFGAFVWRRLVTASRVILVFFYDVDMLPFLIRI